jgi:predicted Zn-dependent protease
MMRGLFAWLRRDSAVTLALGALVLVGCGKPTGNISGMVMYQREASSFGNHRFLWAGTRTREPTMRKFALGQRRRIYLLAGVLLVLVGVVIASHGGDFYRAAYHLRAARGAIERRDYDRAEEQLRLHLQFRPDSAEGHFLLGRLLRRRGQVEEAERQFAKSRSLGWSADAVRLESVLLQVQQGNIPRQVEASLLRRLDNHDPDSFLIHEAFSQGYTRLYRLPQALKSLTSMLDEEPDNAYALTRRGWVEERLGRPDDASKDYQRAVEANPQHVLARQRLAESLLFHAKRMEEAAPHFEVLFRERPNDPAVGANLARCWMETDRLDESRDLLDRLMATHHDGLLLIERGRLALKEGRTERAEEWLRRAVKRQPHSLQAKYALYQCLNHQGKSAEADRVKAEFDLLEAETKRLHELMRRASQGPDPALRCEVAKLFFHFDEDAEGERWLLLALQNDPNYQPAQEALAAYHRRIGKADGAAGAAPASSSGLTSATGSLSPPP